MAPIKIIKGWKPSDKPQTLNKTSDKDEADSPPDISPIEGAYIPFLDRLSLVLTVPEEDDAHLIHSSMLSNFKDKSVFKFGKGGGEFKVGKRIALNCIKDPKKRPLFQYDYDKDAHKATKLRLDFVPVDIGLEGLTQLHAVLMSMVPGGWLYFIEHAHITRVDVTVDVPDLRMGGFVLMPPQAITSMQFWVNGDLRSVTHGKPGGDQTLVYSRKQKRLSKKQTWAGASQVRIERRLVITGGKRLDYLGAMPNPFSKLQMVQNLPGPPLQENANRWAMFEDSVKARGLIAALALLPTKRRTDYRKHLASHLTPWWKPDEIWATWPAAFKAMKIAEPKYWS